MSKYLGDIIEDATIRGCFNTRTAAGAPITLAGTPSLEVYKDANTTQSTAGVTLTVDFDSKTGLHIFAVDTSSDTFYVAGSDYCVCIAAGTVDGTSVVGVCIAHFSIENRNDSAKELLDHPHGVETGATVRQALRVILGAAAGKVSGGGTNTITFRNFGDSLNRIVADVDVNGNRTAITTNLG